MAAAAALGASIPWTPRPTSPKVSLTDALFMSTFDRFARRAISLGRLRFILPNGEELVYGGEPSEAPIPPDGARRFCLKHRRLGIRKAMHVQLLTWDPCQC